LIISAIAGKVNGQEVTTYKTITIGNQKWMAENLNESTFRNGDPIPEIKTVEEWVKADQEGKPAWCYYNNEIANGKKYGKLYNWYAVNDPRGLAPKGWHIPRDKEWIKLTDFLGGEGGAGRKLKSTSGWKEKGNGTNETGFSAFPGGGRFINGTFNGAGSYGYWWSATELNSSEAWYITMVFGGGYVTRPIFNKGVLFAVRSLRDD
jgi:uncharacterized protein (TIGR02145 family)